MGLRGACSCNAGNRPAQACNSKSCCTAFPPVCSLLRAPAPQEAERYFQELDAGSQRDPSMRPNTVTYAALISGRGCGGSRGAASAIVRPERTELCTEGNCWVSLYLPAACSLNVSDPHAACFPHLLPSAAYEKGGQLQRALAAFRRQLATGVPPDLITYSSLISACERAGALPPFAAWLLSAAC